MGSHAVWGPLEKGSHRICFSTGSGQHSKFFWVRALMDASSEVPHQLSVANTAYSLTPLPEGVWMSLEKYSEFTGPRRMSSRWMSHTPSSCPQSYGLSGRGSKLISLFQKSLS